MKNNMKPSFYYSAYPLKAIEQAVVAAKNGNPSPKLKAILTSQSMPPKTPIRMHSINGSYKNMLKALRPRTRKPKDIDSDREDWFRNYE